MNGTIEEVHLRRPVCDECGPLAPLRETPLCTCEKDLEDHFLNDHSSTAREEDA